MGEDKRFILVGQRTLFERSCAVLCDVFEHVCVVIAQDSQSLEANLPVVRDLLQTVEALADCTRAFDRRDPTYFPRGL